MNRSGVAILKRLYHQGIQPFAQPHCVKDSTKIAIRDNIGQHTYGDITKQSDKVGQALKRISNSNSPSSNVAFLTPNNHHYSVIQYGIWKSGNSCVPLCKRSKSSQFIYTKIFDIYIFCKCHNIKV